MTDQSTPPLRVERCRSDDGQIASGIILAMLLFLAPFPLPYAYYQALRWFVTIYSLKTVYNRYGDAKKNLIPLWLSIAILYNPLVPFYLEKTTWNTCDIVVGFCIISHTITLKNSTYVQ